MNVYQHGLIWSNMLRQLDAVVGPQDHFRQLFPWMWLCNARISGKLTLDLWRLPVQLKIRLLDTARSMKFLPGKLPELAIRWSIFNEECEFANQAIEFFPTYTSSIDIYIGHRNLDHAEILSKGVSKLANLRRLILRFLTEPITPEQPAAGLPANPVTYGFPHFLDIEDHLP